MTANYSQYMVEPKSRSEIRALAFALRKTLELDKQIFFPVVNVLEVLPTVLPKCNYIIVEDGDLSSGVYAETEIISGDMMIARTVYDGACKGIGRDRFTIAHEIGHLLMLGNCGFKLQRRETGTPVKTYCDPEWQANCFAGELLVPEHLVLGLSVGQISRRCGVSYTAALCQYDKIHNVSKQKSA